MMASEDPVRPIQLLIQLGGCLFEINYLLKVKGTYIRIFQDLEFCRCVDSAQC